MFQNKLQKFFLIPGIFFFIITSAIFFSSLWDFKADLISHDKRLEFDGTVMPISKIPDWSKVKPSLWNDYKKIPLSQWIETPLYDPEILKTPSDQLKWGVSEDRSDFNEKATYIVPYMGTYKFDGLEYSGSHPGIDIRVPKGTSVKAIGNGEVVEAVQSDSGFGNYIVIRHVNFPSLKDSDLKKTYYSCYGHLEKILVKEGQVVSKNEFIGLSGQSGSASLPHLHFQIDNSEATWHPYWPYKTEEIKEAGYKNDHDSVNNGLGRKGAILKTIHPLAYVQKYLTSAFKSENLHGSAPEKEGGSSTVTRAEAIKLILDHYKITQEEDKRRYFTDVNPNAWYGGYVATAKNLGVVEGYKNGSFKPLKEVTRAEFLKILIEIIQKESGKSLLDYNKKSSFPDIKQGLWYAPYAEYALSEGFLDELVADQPLFLPTALIKTEEADSILLHATSKKK